MYIYKTIPIYNKYSGEQCDTEKKLCAYRCDYSGRLISDYCLDDNLSYCVYKCDYGGEDSCFGSFGDEYTLIEKYKIDAHEFLSEPFMFYQNHDTQESEEANMLLEIAKKKNTIDYCTGIASFLREFKVRTTLKLLEEGTVKPEELGGHGSEWL